MIALRAGHSHLYPGARAVLAGDPPGAEGADCLVDFADGVAVPARIEADGGALTLAVPAYRTARGHPVAARRWRLEPVGDGGRWRVAARLPDP